MEFSVESISEGQLSMMKKIEEFKCQELFHYLPFLTYLVIKCNNWLVGWLMLKKKKKKELFHDCSCGFLI